MGLAEGSPHLHATPGALFGRGFLGGLLGWESGQFFCLFCHFFFDFWGRVRISPVICPLCALLFNPRPFSPSITVSYYCLNYFTCTTYLGDNGRGSSGFHHIIIIITGLQEVMKNKLGNANGLFWSLFCLFQIICMWSVLFFFCLTTFF